MVVVVYELPANRQERGRLAREKKAVSLAKVCLKTIYQWSILPESEPELVPHKHDQDDIILHIYNTDRHGDWRPTVTDGCKTTRDALSSNGGG